MSLKKFAYGILFFLIAMALNASSQKFISSRGKEIIGVDGKAFSIKGTNLGNWLVPEGYMFKFKNVNSPRLIDQVLHELIGPGETNQFWKKYLDNYITEAGLSNLTFRNFTIK